MLLLDDLFKEYCFEIEVRGYTNRTIKSYRQSVNRMMIYLQKTHKITMLDEIKTKHLKSYFLHLKSKGRKESYINSIHRTIRSFFRYCEQEEYLTESENPVNNLSWIKQPNTLIETFNDGELRGMLNAYDAKTFLNCRNKVIIMALCDLGIRNFELCSLSSDNVMETTVKIYGKGKKERYIYISPMLKKFMIKYERLKNSYFRDRVIEYNNYFLSFTGRPLTLEAVERIVKLAGEKAKVRSHIRCSPHTLRHYFSQKQLELGADVYSISVLLGHESIDVTKRYLQSIEKQKIVHNAVKTSPLMNLTKGRTKN
ncbi:tyrosine-type recombinase/integrase [Halobacillus amylolyticus]|uniref:Tyrosine-type recombinase/integrase n=1 Tax=Halobacillus amylolyticus TaxID=2932259 RepID=A0ABY4HCL7_9BACI|nr:tyrosine-type recombinase/integrase [Halobacillus amylolyticus]UOR12177.1 tyrosine-type recombinase/integrase [Halobacillus amylolyticus]